MRFEITLFVDTVLEGSS